MNYGKSVTICCKPCFYLLIFNELSYIDQGNQLLIITDTMYIITILQPSNFHVFLYGYFYSVGASIETEPYHDAHTSYEQLK